MKRILFLLFSCFVSIQMAAQNFTIIVMPDTQHYCDYGPASNAIFGAQTQWIADNRVSRNIVFVTSLGDVVQNADEPDEWALADEAYKIIEGDSIVLPKLPDGIPYGISVGNCDQFPKRETGATAEFNTHFGVSRFDTMAYYGGHYGSKNDNSYQLFSASGLDFIIIHLEYDQELNEQHQTDVLNWADGVLTTHSNRRAIVTSHFMIDRGNEGDPAGNGNDYPGKFGPQGEKIFDALKHHPNLFLMLGGHIATEGERDDVGTNGNTIYTLLSDYQNQDPIGGEGGNGWLRIMEFSPGTNTITVSTYSPTHDNGDGTYGAFGDTPFEDMGGTAANNFGGFGSISEPFTLAYDMTAPLPVELVDFQVRKEGKESIINWKTASEDNNKGFEIQKSADGETWEKLAWVDGEGTTSTAQSYSYIDTKPQRGDNYYRLRQVDYDGTENYSAVRVVNFAFVLDAPVIYPNPVLDELTIEMPNIDNGKITFEIKDMTGKVIIVEQVNLAGETHRINTSSLVPGIYYLDIKSQSSSVSYPFTKTK
ncbi:MAG: T9SS type A sorting domain-containing protein [Saprospiraceae bacterium]